MHDLAVNTRPTQFAIRPTLRNHNAMNREGIIKLVASLVGPGHEVNLKGYDLLIIVEVYQVSLCKLPKRLTTCKALRSADDFRAEHLWGERLGR